MLYEPTQLQLLPQTLTPETPTPLGLLIISVELEEERSEYDFSSDKEVRGKNRL